MREREREKKEREREREREREKMFLLHCAVTFVGPYDNGYGIACRLERWTRDQKVASSNPGRSGGRIFFSGVHSVY